MIQDLFTQIAVQILSQTLLDWTITVTALVYVFLAARQKISCWFWGIISCSLWAYADFVHYNLWVDGVLQIFYVGMGIWGLYSWKYGGKGQNKLKISTLPIKWHLGVFVAGLTISALLGWVFDRYTPTALPYSDSLVTSFSIVATFLTVRKVLENWLYWIVVDFIAIFLFAAREAWLVSFVMVVYTLIAFFGFFNWRRTFAAQMSNSNK